MRLLRAAAHLSLVSMLGVQAEHHGVGIKLDTTDLAGPQGSQLVQSTLQRLLSEPGFKVEHRPRMLHDRDSC